MPDLPFTTRCKSCRSPLASEINARLAKGASPETVAAWLGTLGPELALTGKSIRLHRSAHLMTPETRTMEKAAREVKRTSGDLAALVRDTAYARAESGDLDPTLAEGLRAQEMLDRRAEKGSDRDLMLSVAALLSGAVVPVAISAGASLPALAAGHEDEREADEAMFRELAGISSHEPTNPYRRPGEDVP